MNKQKCEEERIHKFYYQEINEQSKKKSVALNSKLTKQPKTE